MAAEPATVGKVIQGKDFLALSEQLLYRHLEQLFELQQAREIDGDLLRPAEIMAVLEVYKIAKEDRRQRVDLPPLARYSVEQVKRMRELAIVKKYGGNGSKKNGNGNGGGVDPSRQLA